MNNPFIALVPLKRATILCSVAAVLFASTKSSVKQSKSLYRQG
ncbi:MAG: hypothetical protein ACJAQ2_000613 [Vicingaceae bacterium]|jgi:hypothetical protein